MSKHTDQYLHENQRVGHGHRAWWFKETIEKALAIPSHYIGAVPLTEVRRLFSTVRVTRGAMAVTYSDAEGNRQVVTDDSRQVILNGNTGDIFGVFKSGADFRDFNTDLTDNVSGIVGQNVGDLGIETAGLLDFGARAYLSVGIPEAMHDEKTGETFRPLLMAATALDGSLATTYKRVITRPLCDNTVAAALSEGSAEYKIKHTKNSGLKIADARQALSILDETAESFLAELHTLTETPVSDEQWSAFLDVLCPVTTESTKHAVTQATNRRDILANLWINDQRVAPWKGTAWGALQAANTYRQHFAIRRGLGEGDASALRAERNLSDVLSGKSAESDRETVALLSKILQPA
jgi:phage/plasmid-like protein (TIGR03299 family)